MLLQLSRVRLDQTGAQLRASDSSLAVAEAEGVLKSHIYRFEGNVNRYKVWDGTTPESSGIGGGGEYPCEGIGKGHPIERGAEALTDNGNTHPNGYIHGNTDDEGVDMDNPQR